MPPSLLAMYSFGSCFSYAHSPDSVFPALIFRISPASLLLLVRGFLRYVSFLPPTESLVPRSSNSLLSASNLLSAVNNYS